MEVLASAWSSYPKIYTLGHAAIRDIFKEHITVEEKVDGSQFSFGVFDGQLRCRSKGAVLNLIAPQKMFIPGIETAQRLMDEGLLRDGWMYRGEFLGKPKHNTLCYDRIPAHHFIGFDISPSREAYLSYEEKREEFARLGLETVPLLFEGIIEDVDMFRDLLDRESILGGQKIEGVVAKNYTRFTPDGHAMLGKFVSEAFKEIHNGDWKQRNPTGKDTLALIVEKYRTPARWNKAIQRLRDAGELENSPRDIGKLIKAIPQDIREECEEQIKQELFDWAWKQISRTTTNGFPQYYKERLVESAFE